ncbi:MAG TPA: hypothetical protein VGO43_10255 [Pyrinomonadaceae bacterium]|nr:hypothetical protein [Pyrinomonadaceae bacterium]
MNYYNYFTEIEDTFVRRRGRHLFLSPLDWALIDGWKERGIPLHIVIRSIESVFDVFDRQPIGTRTIKSLFYCREEIEAQYNEWLTSRVGSTEDTNDKAVFPAESIAAHVRNAIEKLQSNANQSLAEDLARATGRLEELAADLTGNMESIDGTLGDIEKLLDRAMLTNWDKQHLKVIEKGIAGELRAYKAEMEPEAYRNTYELMLLKRLREEAGIPRLGLFYL